MALLDFDSFDYYQTANLSQVYDAVTENTSVNAGSTTIFDGSGASIVEGFGRCGTNCLKVVPVPGTGGPIRGVAASGATVILAGAFYFVTGSNFPVIWVVRQGTIPIFEIFRGHDGSLVGRRNPDAAFPPTSFISNGGLVPGNTWVHLAVKLVLGDGTSGSVTIAIDGNVVQTITGLDTTDDGTTWTGVQLGGGQFTAGSCFFMDDMTIQDGSGPAPWNDLLGDVHVQRIREVGAGDLTGFTVTGAPTNWEAEDDDDTPNIATYVESNVAGTQDSYEFEDIASVTGQQIFGVKESALARKDVAGNRFLEFLTRKGGVTNLEGTQLGIPTGTDDAYRYVKVVMENDPATSAQWADAVAVNDSQFGMEIAT